MAAVQDFLVSALQVPRALIAASLGLGIFSFLFTVLTRVTALAAKVPILGGVAAKALALLVDSLGPAAKFIPSSTHFFLAAVIAATVLPAPKLPKVPAVPGLAGLLGGKSGRRGAATPSRRR